MTSKLIFAYTEPSDNYPAYLNLTNRAEGLAVLVRASGKETGHTITLNEKQAEKLALSLLQFIRVGDD